MLVSSLCRINFIKCVIADVPVKFYGGCDLTYTTLEWKKAHWRWARVMCLCSSENYAVCD